MADENRVRKDFESGTLGAQLTAGGTTITFGAAPGFATLAADEHIPLIIGTEIVYLTAYTSGATTGTVARGQEGTSDVTHTNGSAWQHGPVASDYPKKASAVFPSSPTTGDRFFRTDRAIEYYYDGSQWLSVHLMACHMSTSAILQGTNGSGTLTRQVASLPVNFATCYMVSAEVDAFVVSPNDGTRYYDLSLFSENIGGGTTVFGTGTTQSLAAGAHLRIPITISNPVITVAAFVNLSATRVGSTPGASYFVANFTYRLIG